MKPNTATPAQRVLAALSTEAKKAQRQRRDNAFVRLLVAGGLPEPVREYRFAAEHVGSGPGVRERLKAAGLNDWVADFAWLPQRVILEVQGAVWTGGAHTRGKGYTRDLKKARDAARLGWRLIACTPQEMRTPELALALGQLLNG